MVGISLLTMIVNAVFSLVILFYLADNETSYMVLMSLSVGSILFQNKGILTQWTFLFVHVHQHMLLDQNFHHIHWTCTVQPAHIVIRAAFFWNHCLLAWFPEKLLCYIAISHQNYILDFNFQNGVGMAIDTWKTPKAITVKFEGGNIVLVRYCNVTQ